MTKTIASASAVVLEELCTDTDCRRPEDTHWHPFSVATFLREQPGEYTVTLRVRTTKNAPPEKANVVQFPSKPGFCRCGRVATTILYGRRRPGRRSRDYPRAALTCGSARCSKNARARLDRVVR